MAIWTPVSAHSLLWNLPILELGAFPGYPLGARLMLPLGFTFGLKTTVRVTILLTPHASSKSFRTLQASLQSPFPALVLPCPHLLYRPQSSTHTDSAKVTKAGGISVLSLKAELAGEFLIRKNRSWGFRQLLRKYVCC